MRYIYVDEAGTSAHEPVSVVVGVIVHADKHWKNAEASVHRLFDRLVPDDKREGFVFHATDLFSGGKQVDRSRWALEARLELIHGMVAIPRLLGMAISVGTVRRGAPGPLTNVRSQKAPITKEQFDHIYAFNLCMGRADKYIRDHADKKEVATVVAEDAPKMRKYLRKSLEHLRDKPITLPAKHTRPTLKERLLGVTLQQTEQKVTRIVDTVHFVDKKDGLLIQISDACAFSFRRWMARQSHGESFVRSMLGSELIRQDWAGLSSAATFAWHSGNCTSTIQRV
ncbi:DUF3800 domain-containing protein [Nevskia sp.]|uniref:DUF3800 domain-containing protein n=1 Tax=Nevskia sp. TaxID=1929292 RepID=UPI0025D47719|nr:DUF3800 domain-containing protein [Nevskia sp.]